MYRPDTESLEGSGMVLHPCESNRQLVLIACAAYMSGTRRLRIDVDSVSFRPETRELIGSQSAAGVYFCPFHTPDP